MPELPDVEGQRRTFARVARGKRVEAVSADRSVLRNTSPQALGRALKGGRFSEPRRHGKWLICPTESTAVLFHFGMTGRLVHSGDETARHVHDRVFFRLDDRTELRYRSMRKLGGVWLARDDDAVKEVIGPVGPDAARVSEEWLRDMLGRRRGGIKGALMDQTFVAGMGNLSSDETLWRAGIDPRRAASSLGREEVAVLYRDMKGVLRDSCEVGHIPGRSSWLTGHREPAASCPRCGTRLDRISVAGRTTYLCPSCQS